MVATAKTKDFYMRRRSITIDNSYLLEAATRPPLILERMKAEAQRSLTPGGERPSPVSRSQSRGRASVQRRYGANPPSRRSNLSGTPIDDQSTDVDEADLLAAAQAAAKRNELQKRVAALKKKAQILVRTIINTTKLERVLFRERRDATEIPPIEGEDDQRKKSAEPGNDQQKNTLMQKFFVKVDRPIFNLTDYLAPKNKNEVTSYLVDKVLSKDGALRTDYDLQLLDRMMLTIPFFQLYARFPMLRREISKSLQYRCFERGRIIVNQGHPCQYVYIILKGNVWMHSSGDLENSMKLTGNDEEEADDPNSGEKQNGSWTKGLKEGQVFGDIELRMKMDRVATVFVQSEYVEMLLMHKSDFERTVISFQEQLNKENVRLLSKIPTVNSLSPSDMESLAEACILKEYASGELVLKQNELYSESIFYVVKGGLKYSRAIPVKKASQDQIKADTGRCQPSRTW